MNSPAIRRAAQRLREIGNAAPRALSLAAADIEETLRADATSKRGNVPSYGKFGRVPITATAGAAEIRVTAAAWVMARARDLGQVDKWAGIIRSRVAAALAGGR